MEMFRISRERFAYGLSASGVANRWNQRSEMVIYASNSRALATLELVVHRNAIFDDAAYKMMVLHVPDDEQFYTWVKAAELPTGWQFLNAYHLLQRIGSSWYRAQSSLVLIVPSAIIHGEYNYVINTTHPDLRERVKLANVEDYFWDARLL